MTDQSDAEFTSTIDAVVTANADYASGFRGADLQVAPTRQMCVVACMDSRMDIFQILGLGNGEAHIIRNAGGVITDDVIRSLCLSQRLLGTKEVVLVHHTDCGLQKVNPDEFNAELEDELGLKPSWSIEAFSDPYADVRQSLQRVLVNPFVVHKEHVRGFVYDVTDGLLREVSAEE